MKEDWKKILLEIESHFFEKNKIKNDEILAFYATNLFTKLYCLGFSKNLVKEIILGILDKYETNIDSIASKSKEMYG